MDATESTVSRRIHLAVRGEFGTGTIVPALQMVAQSLVQFQEAMRREWQDGMQQQEDRMQAALREQEEKARDNTQRALRLQEEQANRKLQEAKRELEAKLEEKDSALRAITQEMERKLGNMKRKVEHQGRPLHAHGEDERVEDAGGEEEGESLERRMTQLETSLQRALDSVFPRVNALVAQLEGKLPFPRNLSSIPSTATASISGSPEPVTSLPAASEPLPSTVRTASPSIFHAHRESLGENLLQAVKAGKVDDVDRLLNAGADPNYSNKSGFSPLMFASLIGHTRLVSLLLQRGADVHAKEMFYGRTALHIVAARRGVSTECVPLLLEAGAPVDCRSGGGWTPLHWAAWNKNYEAVQALLSAGASKTLSTDDGRMPLDLATSDAIQQLLDF